MERYRLGSICKILSGGTPKTGVPEYWNGDRKWITPAELSESSYVVCDTDRKLTGAGVKSAGLTPLPEGTVILSSRAPIGKVAIAGCEMYCNQGFKNLVCSEHIYNKYLYWYLKSKTDFLNSLGRGATFKEISKTTVSEIELDVPEYSEQVEKVIRLEKLQSIITHRRAQLAKLDELVKCRFVEMFGDPANDQSNKWELSSLGKEFEIYSGGTPTTTIPEFWDGGAIPWIGSNACKNVILNTNDGKFITEAGLNNSSARWVHSGYVLIALVGATIGKTALLNFSTTTNQNVAAINVPANHNYMPEFIYIYVQMLHRKFLELGDGGFKMANLNFIRQLPLLSPPVKMQKSFTAFFRQLDKSRLVIQASLAETQKLFDSLMQEYFD